MQLIEYPKCSTCKKAKSWLQEHNIPFNDRNIITDTPTKEELDSWINHNKISINKLFNTSGIKYRQLNLKDKKDQMSKEEQLKLLESDGMLIKRPILITDDEILIGFKEKEWEKLIY